MWIYIPSEFYPSAQELAESSLDLNSQSQLLEQYAMSRSKPLRARSWLAAWKKKDWMQRLFGRILKPSMADLGVEKWIASLADIPASHLVSLEKNSEKTIQDISGLTLNDSSKKSNHQSASLKMFPTTYELDLKKLQMTYNDWVIKLRQACLQRKKSVLLTREKDFLSWPTVIVSDHLSNPTETPQRWKERAQEKKQEGINLHKPLRIVAQETWPTVVSADAEMGEIISPNDTYVTTPSGNLRKINKNGTNGSLGLARTAKIWKEPEQENWPTITVTDASVMKARSPEKMIRKDGRNVLRNPSLAETILQPANFPKNKEDLQNKNQGLPYQAKKSWSTVTTQDYKKRGPNSLQQGLHEESRNWPTVRTSSANGASKKEIEMGNPKQRLEVMISNWPTPRAQEPGSTSPNYGKGLKNTAENWRTPNASDAEGGVMEWREGKAAKLKLRDHSVHAIKTWGTPTTRDWKDSANANVPTNSLLGRQAPQIMKDGAQSQITLNPRFTEWLMGWPVGWTEFELAETEWFRWLRLMRGELLRMECISQKITH